jgi:hypothetical protein
MEESSVRVVYRPTKATKAWVAAGIGVLSFVSAAFGDDVLDWGEVGEGVSLLITTIAGALAVYQTKNAPKD